MPSDAVEMMPRSATEDQLDRFRDDMIRAMAASFGIQNGSQGEPQGRLPARSDAPEGRVSEDIAGAEAPAQSKKPGEDCRDGGAVPMNDDEEMPGD